MAAERWVKAHPGGVLILRGHSDGTYAEAYIYDYLRERGISPNAVVLESPRQAHNFWTERAAKAGGTTFVSITADSDLIRAPILDAEYRHTRNLANWINYNISGFLNPLMVHGVVTQYERMLDIQRTDRTEGPIQKGISLGALVLKDLGPMLGLGSHDAKTLAKENSGNRIDPSPVDVDRSDKGPKKPPGRNDSYPFPGSRPPPSLAAQGAPMLGGVDPNVQPAIIGTPPLSVEAVVVDPSSGKLVVLAKGGGQVQQAIDPVTFALALWVTYTGQHLAFSLDPADPSDPHGEWLRAESERW